MTANNTSSDSPLILWFRTDLRLDDNAALAAAVDTRKPVICLYILEDPVADHLALGGAQKWWLHHSLTALSTRLDELGAKLILRSGTAENCLDALIAKTGADSVFWNRRYAPAHIDHDSALKEKLTDDGLTVRSFDGHLMHEPTRFKTKSGGFYKVYTPFWRAFAGDADAIVRDRIAAPDTMNVPSRQPESETLDDWALLPTKPNWATGIAESWTPGEKAAHERLDAFLDGPANAYDDGRDLPAKDGTSRLSPHFAFGELSPVTVWHRTKSRPGPLSSGREAFLKELVWREFSYHLLVNCDGLAKDNYNADFDHFPWNETDERLQAWQKGRTGYPIVDAGMRQLWQTGWMHNRVRMIVGSFLVKHLLFHWHHGERWFWDTLVDGDPASNAASWQWVAGSGADAAPYFRIFNPILQGEKFDPDGDYVKLFVPELVDLDKKYIHKPWEAPEKMLKSANIRLGETYPEPIVEHKAARQRALDAYQTMKGQAA
jgi:deoxyribodipyrimidine photo-lyase